MIWVILKTGKVLQYNQAGGIKTQEGCITLFTTDDGCIVKFPSDGVERIEFHKPCKIMREKPVSKIKKFY
jgi:hypothetical protein